MLCKRVLITGPPTGMRLWLHVPRTGRGSCHLGKQREAPEGVLSKGCRFEIHGTPPPWAVSRVSFPCQAVQ